MDTAARAKLATFLARCFGAALVLAGVALFFLAALEPTGRLVAVIVGAVLILLGAAFLRAKQILAEDIETSRDGLSLIAGVIRKRRSSSDGRR